jgi:hypothetical protein
MVRDGQADHIYPREAGFDVPGGFNTVQSRHLDIHQDDIGTEGERHLNGGEPIVGCGFSDQGERRKWPE